jgi:hypothetical protein
MSAKKRAPKQQETARLGATSKTSVKSGARPIQAQAIPARATQKPAHTASTEARVEHIADLMRSLEFRTGETTRELAAKWRITVQRVWELSSIASKRVRAELTDPDRIVVKVAAALEKVIDDALRETDEPALIEKQGKDGERVTYPESPNGARRVLIEAAKTLCILTGNAAPQKHEVKDVSRFERMTADEHRAELARLKVEIEAEEVQLAKVGGTLQ